MNSFQETLGQQLRPQFEALTQSPILLVLIERSGKVDISEVLRACPGVSNTARLSGGVYGPSSGSPNDWVWRDYQHDCYDDDKLLRLYRSLAAKAGNRIKEWAECFGVACNTITERYGEFKWVYLLFDLAWSDNPRFHMEARKRYIKSWRIDELQMKILGGYFGNSEIAQAREEIKQLRELGFYSTLSDVALASVYVIDVLTQPAATGEGAGHEAGEAYTPIGADSELSLDLAAGKWFQDDPPQDSKFQFGILEGPMKSIATWMDMDYRTLKNQNGCASWWIKKVHSRKFSVWFSTQIKYAEANKRRLAEDAQKDMK